MRRRGLLGLIAASIGFFGYAWVTRGEQGDDWEECPCPQVQAVTFDAVSRRGATTTHVTIRFTESFRGQVRVRLLDENGEGIQATTQRVDDHQRYEIVFNADRPAEVGVAISEE